MAEEWEQQLADQLNAQRKSSSLRQAVANGVTQNPDDYAKQLTLAERTGVSPEIVKGNENDLHQAAESSRIDYDKFTANYPRTSGWATLPDNAPVAGVDDILKMGEIEAHSNTSRLAGLTPSQQQAVIDDRQRIYQQHYDINGGQGALSKAWGEARSAAANINTAFTGAFTPLVNAAGVLAQNVEETGQTALNTIAGFEGKPLERLHEIWLDPRKFEVEKYTGAVHDFLAAPIKQGPTETLTDPTTGKTFANPDFAWWGRGTVNAAEQVPGILSAFALTGKVAGPQVIAPMIGLQSAQTGYAEAKAAGDTEARSILAATGMGISTYALMGLMPQPVAPSSFTGAVAQWAGRSAGLGLGLTVSENAYARGYDPERDLMHGWQQSIATMAAYEGLGAVHNILDVAAQSQLKTRSQAKYREAVQASVEGTPFENLRVPVEQWDAYWQSQKLDPGKVAEQLGVSRLYTEAKIGAGGEDVIVPTADLVSKLGNEHLKGLEPDVRGYDDFGKPTDTPRQLQEKIDAAPAAKEMTAQADAETALSPELTQVKDELRQRYVDAGETEAVADTYATLHANAIGNMAREAKLTPVELMRIYDPKVRIGEPGAGEQLDQSVFHGSPHQFDKFTTDNIGTGEGVQAYGHGLYFAGNKEVAEFYRKTLAGDRFKVADGGTFIPDDLEHLNVRVIARRGDVDGAITKAQEIIGGADTGSFNASAAREMAGRDLAVLEGIKQRGGISKHEGQLYEADIPEDPTMLDWDKPLSQQPEAVQKAFDTNEYDFHGMARALSGIGKPTGKQLYGVAVQLKGSPEAASKYLNSLGITGIKYLDGSSRGSGEGQHNYVVFDDKAIKVLNTFYQGGEGAKRGWFRVLPDGTFEIGKTKLGDLSTFVHEPAHSYLFMLADLAKREGSSDTLKDDYAKILGFLGAKDGEALTREQNETWARANEQYLREGKAPTQGMRGVFQRVAVWLASVYKYASDLRVDLNDDIRGVFDRLYASEEGVNKAHEEIAGPQIFTSAEEAGWTPEQFQAYADAKGMEVDKAKEEVLAKLNEAAIRDRSEAWVEEQRNTRDAITESLDKRPEYTAIRSLRRGSMDDGTALTLSREALVKQFGEARVKELQSAHRGLYRLEGGVDADAAAEILGFDSGEAMMAALESAPRRSKAIEQGTRDFMTQKHGDIRYDGTLDDQARIAVENDQRAANLHKELTALKRQLDKVKAEQKAHGKAVASINIAPLDTYRDAARALVETTQIMSLQPTRYLDASRKFSREAFEALRSGDTQKAAEAKQKELVNHFLFREAVKAKDEANKAYAYAKKFDRASIRQNIAKAGGDQGQHVYLDQIDNIRDMFRFERESGRAIQERQSFADFAMQQQAKAYAEFFALNPDWMKDHPDGETPEIPQMVDTSIEGVAKNYRELNIVELRAVTDALKNIEALARNDGSILRDGKRVSFAQEVANFTRDAREANTAKAVPRAGTKFGAKERATRWIHGIDAYMQKIEWLVDALDGGKIDGPARANIKKPIDDAWGDSLKMGDEVFSKLEKVVNDRPKQDVADLHESTGIQFPLFDRPLTRLQLISWALNLGTEENQKVALIGEGLINPDGSMSPLVDQALKSMRSSELRYVQGVWDVLNGMLPAIREKALRTTGIEPKMKTVTPFEVTSVDGESVNMRGGYYPLKGEPGDRVGMMQNDPANQAAIGYTKPKTSTSHIKTVTGATYRLQLDYQSVLSRHLADVINDTTKGEAISQVYKFISNDEVRTTIKETLGEKEEGEFLKWLQDFSGNNKGGNDNSPLLDFLMSRRSGMVAARLGGNLGSYLIQVGDVFKSIADPDIKTSYMAKAFLDIRMHPTATIEEIRRLSPNEMLHREKNFNREIRDMITERDMFDAKKEVVTNFLMEGFQVMDRLVTFPAWLGRYRQGFDEHGDSARAVMEADRAVARDYQAGDNRNMSRMMRQGGWTKLMTTFQGDSNTWYGLISASIRSGNKKAISVGLMALIAEQIVGQYIKNRGPQKNSNKAGWAMEQALIATVGKVPVLGDLAQYAVSKATGQFASLENPTMQGLEKSASVFADARGLASGKKSVMGDVAPDVFEATGIWVGIPGTSQAVRTWKYLHKVQTGKERPANAYDLVTSAIFGKTKPHK